jgi:hypothetical protein
VHARTGRCTHVCTYDSGTQGLEWSPSYCLTQQVGTRAEPAAAFDDRPAF